MNILIPHSWLLEHLDTQATPEDIQRYLSLCGPSVERIYDREGESVYDIEVTTNRVDSMSVRGIAREAAVILPQFGVPAKLKALELPTLPAPTITLPAPQIENLPEVCHRIAYVILKDVQRTPTPELMSKRLLQIEQHVHDSVIDITNYITHELGHPCHAFDYDRIMELGGVIKTVIAKPGQKFETLDGEKYTTVGGEVVYVNDQGTIIDLPGIKGTVNSAINQDTKNVLLWIESIDAQKIRFASMTHAIRTVAAQLNEKQVDPELALPVLLAGAKWYQELCHATIASEVFDEYPHPVNATSITVTSDDIERYLGLTLPMEQVTAILEALECQVTEGTVPNSLSIKPPSFRPDLEIPADIIEEVARIYGFHNLPNVIMPTAIPTNRPTTHNFNVENKIKHVLSDLNWQEVYTYSLVSDKIASESGHELSDHLKLQNPLTDDRVYLRRTLIPSLHEVLHNNPQRADLSVFEIANTYQPRDKDLPQEVLHLTLVSRRDYRSVRGILEVLLGRLFVNNSQIKPLTESPAMFSQTAEILVTNQLGVKVRLGMIGILKTGEVAIDILMSEVLLVAQTHPKYQPIPKTAALTEDMTFTLPEKTPIGDVMDYIKDTSPLIAEVALLNQYQQNSTFTISYWDPQTSVSAEMVEPIRKAIVTRITKEYQAQFVGQLS